MCGFVGYVNRSGEPADPAIVRAMADMIAHRGPDGEGYAMEGPLGFGHRRLAIIDLSAEADQPMTSVSDRYVMVYNGEIYNFMDVRRDLEAVGRTFSTRSDSEVLLSAFETWGTDAFVRLNGMFALALYDRKERRLTLARDRFGVKPLYYVNQNGVLAFASEAKAFRAHPKLSLSLNTEGLAEYLTFMNFISDQTLFKGVHLFPAGSFAQIDLDKTTDNARLETTQFWDFRFTGDSETYDRGALADEIHDAFTKAVRRQLVSDVGFSSFLSGGVDSGSITAIASREPGQLRTFTAYFDYEGASASELKFDERAAAHLMAQAFGTEHHELAIGAEDFMRVFHPLCDHLDEPRVGQSYPNYLISGFVRQKETVTLSGCGGDELFGGYPWRYYQGLPADNFNEYADGYYAYWRRLAKTDAELAALTTPISSDLKGFDARQIFEGIYPQEARSATRPEELLNWSLYFETKTFMNGLLMVEDKVSMAHSLETRVPFLDNELADVACRTPIQAKLAGIPEELERQRRRKAGLPVEEPERRTDGKAILRYMMARLVPDEIANREKQGFSAPDATWFKAQAYDFVADKLLDPSRRLHDVINPVEIKAVVEGHKAGTREDGRLKIWSFLHLAEVLDNYGL